MRSSRFSEERKRGLAAAVQAACASDSSAAVRQFQGISVNRRGILTPDRRRTLTPLLRSSRWA
jgi:hypothetical protein